MSRIMPKYIQEKQKAQMINICTVKRATVNYEGAEVQSQLFNLFVASEF